MFNKLKEKCGIYFVNNTNNASFETYLALHNLQHRGQEGCGIASLDGEQIKIHKNVGLVENVFSQINLQETLPGRMAIGHVRYSTSGDKDLKNVQPLYFNHSRLSIAIVHNGNISNQDDLKKELEDDGSILNSTSDTELVGHFIIKYFIKYNDIKEAVKRTAQKLEGGFNIIVLSKFGAIVIKDKHGFRPLVLGETKHGHVISSETCALNINDAKYVRDIEAGELVWFKTNNEVVFDRFASVEETSNNVCAMELIYFARPDSNINNRNVHLMRQKLGEKLAEQLKFNNGTVIGVPDSSLSAATGFAKYSGLNYEMGIVKNRYIARTFITPNQDSRYASLKKKFAINEQVIKGKDIILVDDSIVRGSTMKVLIKLIMKYNPKSIRLCIASPKIFNPCYYGIDMSTKKELIANEMNESEMATYLGIESVSYLTLDNLKEVFKEIGVCHACFSGDYLTKIK